MRNGLLALWLAAAVMVVVTPLAAAEPKVLTPERVFAAPDLSGPVARGVALSPDGALVTFLKPKPGDQRTLDLWAAPTEGDGPARLLVDATAVSPGGTLSEAEIARRERQRVFDQGIVEYRWDDQGKRILVPVSGELFLADVATGAVTKRVSRGDDGGSATDARFSPAGTHISYVRDGTLFVAPALQGAPKAVTPKAEGAVSYAVAEFVAQEEFARDTGYWWSPDETAIAYTRVDESGVGLIPRAEFGADGSIGVVTQRYPLAGTPNAIVDLYVKRLAGGAPVKVDLGTNPDIYLLRVHWSRDGRTLYVQRQSRDQQTLDLLASDPETGKSRVILTERQAPWVEVTSDFTPLRDGGFLWTSSGTGFQHLYLYDRDAKLVRAVTSGDFPLAGFDRVKSLVGVDEVKGLAYVLASATTPIERHLHVVDYRNGGPMKQVSGGSGWWSFAMNAPGTAYVGTFSNPATPPQTALYGADGERRRWIVENPLDASHPYAPFRDGLPVPEFGTLAAEDGQAMHYVLLKPRGFDPRKRYSAVVQVYGGPGRQHVTKGWRPPQERLLLEAGHIVFQLDNRGTANRGMAFEGVIAGRLGTPEVQDQLAGLKFLRSLPYVDPKRIGMTGWSYGGYMTLRMMTEPGSGLAAGAAGAAPGEWAQYDTHYTERFMGMPQANAAAYTEASVLPRLGRLSGRLLLMHGMADDNVLFSNATGIMSMLQEQGRTFDLMLYPGQRHGIQPPPLKLQQWRTYLEFFDRTLAPE